MSTTPERHYLESRSMDAHFIDTGMLMIGLHGRLVSVTVCLLFTRIFGLRAMIRCPGKMDHDDSVRVACQNQIWPAAVSAQDRSWVQESRPLGEV